MNGNSPLTEKFLRSRHLLKKSGTQLFITHPQISQVPTVNAETYDKEIERNARMCRLVRAQKHKFVFLIQLKTDRFELFQIDNRQKHKQNVNVD